MATSSTASDATVVGHGAPAPETACVAADFAAIYEANSRAVDSAASVSSALWTDLNGDGWEDILWQNDATGDVYYFLMRNGRLIGQAYLLRGIDTNWKIVGTPDLDQDGWSDLLWLNIATGDVFYQFVDGVRVGNGGFIYRGADLVWWIVGS